MVVIDDHRNGWRHLVLPVARLDELVRAAVLSTSASHFTTNVTDRLLDPRATYQEVLHRLRQRQHLQDQDVVGKQTIVLALLLLLTTVMVNGQPDFHSTFQLLEAALSAIGGEEELMEGELGLFLVTQIRK